MLAKTFIICKHFDTSVDAERRYYNQPKRFFTHSFFDNHIHRVYFDDSNVLSIDVARGGFKPNVNNSCIGDSPGKKLVKCKFNGYLKYDELCNPCGVKEFEERCEELCKTTAGNRKQFGPYRLM